MFVLVILELALAIFIISLMFTQIIFPLIKRTKLFPAFRKTRKSLEEEIIKANSVLEEQQLKEELAILNKRIDEYNRNTALADVTGIQNAKETVVGNSVPHPPTISHDGQ